MSITDCLNPENIEARFSAREKKRQLVRLFVNLISHGPFPAVVRCSPAI